ncbi:hypothetical protein F4X90_15805 [Candidatus Poribacteria bacterium]|nr:hypothetical protein [Candidatus Poribacteria bacterium]
MTINQLSEMRKNGLRALIENGWFEGFKRLLTDLYPDNAHFIYELLQNAEDARASKVHFVLNADKLEFEHNGGKLFEIEDVESITNIGSSTKTDDPTNIGEFGIGFKAVFAYTNTPEIESGKFHFRIRDMVVPDTEGLSPGALGARRTRFVFPFDNPKKSPENAVAEIKRNLQELNENTLLFLDNIRQINYNLPDSKKGSLERKKNTDDGNQIEISVKHPESRLPKSTHYLRFTKNVNVQDEDDKSKCRQIAIAFGVDMSKSGHWKIIPLNPGQVCIYFPAVKEPCNLRFHIHAPFASTVARDSVRDCPANDELRDHIADLVAESMHSIRDQGLLDVRFLATLPNNKDNLSSFCDPIRERLIEEFNQTKLTPMKQGGHAPASGCYRGRRDLSDLINDEDLATLLGKCCSQPLWITNPQQRNQQDDNFLSMLDISIWTIEDLVEVLEIFGDITKWLEKKSNAWHQKLYAFLGDFLSSAQSDSVVQERKDQLSKLCIVRCNDKTYRIGSECRFSNDDMKSDPPKDGIQENGFHFVAKGVYSYGKNKSQQEKARKFLDKIGVSEWNVVTEVLDHILPKYRNSTSAIPRKKFNRDFTKIVKAYRTDPQQLREELMTTPLILTKDSRASNLIYLKPDQLHFGVGDTLWRKNSIGIYSAISVTKKVRQFLQKLKIPQWDIVDEIIKTILPKYEWNSSRVPIKEHMSDFKKIALAYNNCGELEKMRLQIKLKATRFILKEGTHGHNPEYCKPNELYFPIDKLRLYFEGNRTYKFVSSEYLDRHVKMFRELRISDKIRIICESKPGTTGDIRLAKQGRYYRRGLKGFDPDIQVDGLKHALMNPSVEKSKIIWEYIVGPYSHCIKGKLLMSSRENFSVHARTLEENEVISDFGHLLMENAWLPNSDGNMHKPSELTLKELHKEFVPDERLGSQLGMKKGADAELAEETGIPVEVIELIRQNPEECSEFFKELQAKKVLEQKEKEIPEQPIEDENTLYDETPVDTSSIPSESLTDVDEKNSSSTAKDSETPEGSGHTNSVGNKSTPPTSSRPSVSVPSSGGNSQGETSHRETRSGNGQHGKEGDNVYALLPEEISETEGSYEGARKQISVNTYERDQTARDKCLQHYGTRCAVCEKDMSEIYGPEAEGLIHVHHLKPLSEIKEGYRVNPIADLRPVCPNCHAVIHRGRPVYKIEEVKGFLEKVRQDG